MEGCNFSIAEYNKSISRQLRFNQGAATALQVVPAQVYRVELAFPSVRRYSEPGPLDDVPQAAEGAPLPAEIDAPFRLIPLLTASELKSAGTAGDVLTTGVNPLAEFPVPTA